MSEKAQCTKCNRPGLDAPGLCPACKADRENGVKKFLAATASVVVSIVGFIFLRRKI